METEMESGQEYTDWEREHLEFQSKFEWLPEWPQDDVLEF